MRRIVQIIVSLGLLGAAVVIGVLFVWPQYDNLSSTQQRIEEYQDRLQRGERALERLRRMQEEVRAHEEDFDKIALALPEEADVPALFDNLQQMAVTSGLVLTDVEEVPRPQPVQPVVPEIGLQLELAGSYQALKTFLDEARRSTRMFNLESITIESPPSTAQQTGALSITVVFVAYTQ